MLFTRKSRIQCLLICREGHCRQRKRLRVERDTKMLVLSRYIRFPRPHEQSEKKLAVPEMKMIVVLADSPFFEHQSVCFSVLTFDDSMRAMPIWEFQLALIPLGLHALNLMRILADFTGKQKICAGASFMRT